MIVSKCFTYLIMNMLVLHTEQTLKEKLTTNPTGAEIRPETMSWKAEAAQSPFSSPNLTASSSEPEHSIIQNTKIQTLASKSTLNPPITPKRLKQKGAFDLLTFTETTWGEEEEGEDQAAEGHIKKNTKHFIRILILNKFNYKNHSNFLLLQSKLKSFILKVQVTTSYLLTAL